MGLEGLRPGLNHFEASAAGRPGFGNFRAVLVTSHWLLYNGESTGWGFNNWRLDRVAVFLGFGHMLSWPLL
jgi:hypothetical protein